MLPYRVILALGSGIGRAGYRFAGDRRRIAETNLALCFPEKDAAWHDKVLRQHFQSLGISLLEIPLGWWGSDQKLGGLVHIEGLQHLQQAKAGGKGVLLLSAHFTCLEIGGRLLAMYSPFHVMYRRDNNPVMEKVISGQRRRLFQRAIPRDSVRDMIRSLKGGNAVWYAPDQNTARKESVFVGFFGHVASTNSATARLAKLTGAPVVPFKAVRKRDGSGYELLLEAPLADFPGGDLEADTQRINDIIESWVRQDPEQYLWIHRRFRTRPNKGDPPVYQ